MILEFHPEAEDELIESALYYESKIGDLGYRFIKEVEEYSVLLQRHPELGQSIDEHFPYSLIYTYTLDTGSIWILAVAHQHKLPGYWRGRIDS